MCDPIDRNDPRRLVLIVQPRLSWVDRFTVRLGSASGGVGLWVDSQEGSFANLQIQRAS